MKSKGREAWASENDLWELTFPPRFRERATSTWAEKIIEEWAAVACHGGKAHYLGQRRELSNSVEVTTVYLMKQTVEPESWNLSCWKERLRRRGMHWWCKYVFFFLNILNSAGFFTNLIGFTNSTDNHWFRWSEPHWQYNYINLRKLNRVND